MKSIFRAVVFDDLAQIAYDDDNNKWLRGLTVMFEVDGVKVNITHWNKMEKKPSTLQFAN